MTATHKDIQRPYELSESSQLGAFIFVSIWKQKTDIPVLSSIFICQEVETPIPIICNNDLKSSNIWKSCMPYLGLDIYTQIHALFTQA